ncbi:MAG: NAD(P)H-hydrate dehydratase [Spirochaetaceae bacterium JB067]
MNALVSTKTMETIDSQSIHQFSIPGLLLMEHAGVKGFQSFRERSSIPLSYDDRIVVVAGGGNNGGDALVMAREAYLEGFRDIAVILLGSHISQSCALHRAICDSLDLPVHQLEFEGDEIDQASVSLLSSARLIIDGFLGTGVRGNLQPAARALIALINSCHEKGSFVLSVDVPSGCSDSISVNQHQVSCDVCVTFGLAKSSLYHPVRRRYWKKLLIVNPSFPPELLEQAPKEALLASEEDLSLEPVDESSYKNRRGHIAMFAGSEPYTGASHLASKAAFMSGSGLVTLFCDEEVALTFRQQQPSLIVRSQGGSRSVKPEELAGSYDVIAVGPGWGDDREEQMVQLLRSDIPMVCDADGIRTFASVVQQRRVSPHDHAPIILTPHPGEIQQMMEILNMPLAAQELGMLGTSESFIESLKKIATQFNLVLVYKSHVVWIIDGTKENSTPVVVDGNNSALGVAGSGDVLTGIIASMLAAKMPAFECALKGVLLHQRAGKIARDTHRWFDSELLLEYIGKAMEEVTI